MLCTTKRLPLFDCQFAMQAEQAYATLLNGEWAYYWAYLGFHDFGPDGLSKVARLEKVACRWENPRVAATWSPHADYMR